MIASVIINFLLLFLGIKTFFSKGAYRYGFIIAFFLIFSSCIKLIPVDAVPTSDIAMLLCFVVYAIYACKISLLHTTDSLGKAILAFLFLVVIRSLFALFYGEESLQHILVTLRPGLFWLTYFTFCMLSSNDFEKAWKIIRILVTIACLLSLLQYLHFNFLGYHPLSSIGRVRIPFGTEFLFFWAILSLKQNKIQSILIIALCMLLFIKNGSRFGIVLQVLMVSWILLSFVVKRKGPLLIIIFLCLGSLGLWWNSIDLKSYGRFSEIKNDTRNFALLANQSSEKFEYLESGKSATMVFRLALAKERISYLSEHPLYLLFGIGPIYDDPKNENNHFNFYLGTRRSDRRGIHQIETVDISFVTILFRYGLVGLAMFISLLFRLFTILRKNRSKNIFVESAYYVFLLYTFQFLGSCKFDYFFNMGLILLIAGTVNNGTRKILWNSNPKL